VAIDKWRLSLRGQSFKVLDGELAAQDFPRRESSMKASIMKKKQEIVSGPFRRTDRAATHDLPHEHQGQAAENESQVRSGSEKNYAGYEILK
jgi:hypothetical protein